MRVSGLMRDLDAAGMRVVIGDDFSVYRIYRSSQSGRAPMYPMFDVASSYVDASNGFWICGFGPDDEVIHTQAVRLLDLSGSTLGAHLDTHRHKYITPDTTPDPDLTYYSGPAALATITGRVAYHGDFWLQPNGLGGMRSQGATGVLSRILFELVHWHWAPDFTFALIPHPLAAKGAHLRYGYTHCEPGTWIGPDQQVTETDYMVWMSKTDMANALGREPQALRSTERSAPSDTTVRAIGPRI